jgi:hypothetical protein
MVPAAPTPYALDDAIPAFVAAWALAIESPRVDDPGSDRAIAVAIAHCCLECGNFGYRNGKPADPPTCYCNNIGNTRAAAGEDCDVCQYPGNEIIGGKVVWFKPPDPLSTFRAFPTLADGIAAQLRFISHWDPKHDPHYAAAWRACVAGDPATYVRELKAGGYFTGDETPYERAVVSIFARVLPAVQRAIAGQPHGITDEDREHVSQLVAATLDAQRLDWMKSVEPDAIA